MCSSDLGVQFKAAATVSITYALMSRCGLEPERYFDHEDFMAIFDFNTPATIGALGTAVSQINQQVLRQIGVTVRNAEREANQERSKQDEQSHDLHPERRLSDSRPEAEPAAGEIPGQVRQDEENLSEGTPSHPLQPDAAEREAVPAPSGDRRDRPEPVSYTHLTDGIEQGIKELFESEKYMRYLSVMSRFHRYSVNNTMLIYMQKPDATLVAGYNKWKDQFERHEMCIRDRPCTGKADP